MVGPRLAPYARRRHCWGFPSSQGAEQVSRTTKSRKGVMAADQTPERLAREVLARLSPNGAPRSGQSVHPRSLESTGG